MSRLFAVVTFALVLTAALHQAQPAFDILIVNGRVLDGSGNPWIRAGVGIRGDRIVAVGQLKGAAATIVIDARDRYVAPGFVDAHSHAVGALTDAQLREARPLLAQD